MPFLRTVGPPLSLESSGSRVAPLSLFVNKTFPPSRLIARYTYALHLSVRQGYFGVREPRSRFGRVKPRFARCAARSDEERRAVYEKIQEQKVSIPSPIGHRIAKSEDI